jgi:hypothetical protein
MGVRVATSWRTGSAFLFSSRPVRIPLRILSLRRSRVNRTSSPEITVRRREAFANLRGPEALRTVPSLTIHGNPVVRAGAARMLGRFRRICVDVRAEPAKSLVNRAEDPGGTELAPAAAYDAGTARIDRGAPAGRASTSGAHDRARLGRTRRLPSVEERARR